VLLQLVLHPLGVFRLEYALPQLAHNRRQSPQVPLQRPLLPHRLLPQQLLLPPQLLRQLLHQQPQ
jgi:hypothetical protein